jgi:hypothetical protein
MAALLYKGNTGAAFDSRRKETSATFLSMASPGHLHLKLRIELYVFRLPAV